MRKHKKKVNVSLLSLGLSLALVGCGSENALVKSEDLEYLDAKGVSSFNFTDINVDGHLLTFNWGASVKSTDNSDVTYTVCKKDLSQPNNCLVVSDLIKGNKADVDIGGALNNIGSEFFIIASDGVNQVFSNTLTLEKEHIDSLIVKLPTSLNVEDDNLFGNDISLSDDGKTLAVGAYASNLNHGVVFVYRLTNAGWTATDRLTPQVGLGENDYFGYDVELSGDGNVLLVSSHGDDSKITDENGVIATHKGDDTSVNSGASYIFEYIDGQWSETAFLKPNNSYKGDQFGKFSDINTDGTVVAIAAHYEDSSSTGINSTPDNLKTNVGAVYLFEKNSENQWKQTTYFKPVYNDKYDGFGMELSLSGDGLTLAVSALFEDSGISGIFMGPSAERDAAMTENLTATLFDKHSFEYDSGAVYLYQKKDGEWTEGAIIKGEGATDEEDLFGKTVKLNEDGTVLAVTASGEDSTTGGINVEQNNEVTFDVDKDGNKIYDENGNVVITGYNSGMVYVYKFDGTQWTQDTTLKQAVPHVNGVFGWRLSMNKEGSVIAATSVFESSNASGLNGSEEAVESGYSSGAAYLFSNKSGQWEQTVYVKSKHNDAGGYFGSAIALDATGETLVVGAMAENSTLESIEEGVANAGSVYVY